MLGMILNSVVWLKKSASVIGIGSLVYIYRSQGVSTTPFACWVYKKYKKLAFCKIIFIMDDLQKPVFSFSFPIKTHSSAVNHTDKSRQQCELKVRRIRGVTALQLENS